MDDIKTLEIEIQDLETLLKTAKPNWDSLDAQDRQEVCILYPHSQTPCTSLTNELIESIRDTEWKRTKNFEKLVILGFLCQPQPHSTTKKQPCTYLTKKWALFLGVSYKDLICLPEIQQAAQKYREAVKRALKDWGDTCSLWELCKDIVDSVPDFRNIFPPNILPIKFLQEMMSCIAKGYRTNLCSIPRDSVDKIQYEQALNVGKKLWWFPQESSMKDQKSFWYLLTEKGKVYMDTFRKMTEQKT